VQFGQRLERAVKGLGVGVAHARHDVPVMSGPARERQRRTRADHVQAALGIQHVPQAQQIVLVGSAAVMKNEQAGGIAVGRTLAEDERAHPAQPNFAARPRTESLGR
jgi:hypothetical protein